MLYFKEGCEIFFKKPRKASQNTPSFTFLHLNNGNKEIAIL